MIAFNRKLLTLTMWSVWLIILAIIPSNVAAVPCGLISEFGRIATFIYDGQSQTKVAYDRNAESTVDYDAVAVLVTGENKNATTADRISFAKIAQFLAAKGEVVVADEGMNRVKEMARRLKVDVLNVRTYPAKKVS